MKNAASVEGWAPLSAGGGFRPPVAIPAARFQIYEYAYYFLVFYALIALAYGLSFGSLGIVMHVCLAAVCILRLGSKSVAVLRPLSSIILCGVWFVANQVLMHGSSVTNPYIRPFAAWILALIIVKSLCTRPGFLQRATMAIFVIGLTMLPFLDVNHIEGRAGLSAGVLANSNDLAAWFGFCALVFTIRGLETRQPLSRWLCWAVGLFNLFIVGLTVGRGALGGFAIGAVIALRKQLKRSFVPVLALIVLIGGAFALGVFDSEIERYTDRGAEETGRFLVWPLIVERIVASPLIGVPAEEFGTSVFAGFDVTPHNGLLFIALGGGLVPLLFFVAHWLRAFQGAMKHSAPENPDSAYLLPLLVYSFVIIMTLSEGFMSTWCVIIVCACLHNLQSRYSIQKSGRMPAVVVKSQPYRELVTTKL